MPGKQRLLAHTNGETGDVSDWGGDDGQSGERGVSPCPRRGRQGSKMEGYGLEDILLQGASSVFHNLINIH
jgi:hypothetical protein